MRRTLVCLPTRIWGLYRGTLSRLQSSFYAADELLLRYTVLVNTKAASLNKPTIQRDHRDGEGYAVEATVQHHAGVATFQLSVSDAPVPDRRFSADTAAVQVTAFRTRLCFGQSKPVGNGWLSMVVVELSSEGVTHFLTAVQDSKNGGKFLAPPRANGASDLTEFNSSPDHAVILSANLTCAGFVGSEGCMDFYNASAFSVQRLPTTNKLQIEPIVRINLPSPLIFAIVQKLRELNPATTTHKIV